MPQSLTDILRALPAAGSSGFEGLIAALLCGLTGQQFALAQSGTQEGRDISSRQTAANVIAVECKRYQANTKLNERELLGEVVQSVGDIRDLDLWVLVASRDVSSQLREALQQATNKLGVELLIISDGDGPPSSLEVLCAHAPELVVAYVQNHLPGEVPHLQQLLAEIALQSGFVEQLASLKTALVTPLLGYDSWRHAQNQWLTECFRSEPESRARFGQLLNIAQEGITLVERREAWQQLDAWLSSWKDTRRSIAILGQEGDGKTWAVASWVWRKIVQDPQCPPVLFVSSAEVQTDEPQAMIEHAVARSSSLLSREQVQKRLGRWQQHSDTETPLFLLVLDGINERYDVQWWRTLLEKLNGAPWRTVAAVIITCRTGFWENFASLRSITATRYTLPPYSDDELDMALEAHNLRRTDIQPELLLLARKPRYLDLLIQHRERIAESGDVTVARLIYEDWRDRWQRKRSLPLGENDFQNLLRDLAHKYLAGEAYLRRPQLIELLPSRDEQVVEELRTGGVLREHKGHYQVQRPQLGLGLAFVLVDQVEKALREEWDLTETIAAWLEPHAGMDIKAEICEIAALSALHINDLPVSAKAALLRAWITSQNVGEKVGTNLSAYFPVDPRSYFELAEGLWSAPVDHGWGQKVLMDTFLHWIMQPIDAHVPLWQAACARWLGFIPRFGYPFLGERTDQERLEAQQTIAERLGFELPQGSFSLAGYDLTPIDDDGLLRLGHAALALISHVPREPFIHGLATGCVAEAVINYPSKYAEFAWVIRTSEQSLWKAIQAEVELLIGSNTRIGQQAACRLLSFVGSTEARHLQETFPDDLFSPHPLAELHRADPCVGRFSWSREDCERCVARADVDPRMIAREIQEYCIDPNLDVPADFGTRLAPIAETIDVQSMDIVLGYTSADHDFETYEPALCAYAPEALASVVHCLVSQMSERASLALRQSAIFLKKHSLILIEEDHTVIDQVWSTVQQISGSGDKHADEAEWFLFPRVLQHLDASSQLVHLLSRHEEALDLLSYEHYFLPVTDWGTVWQQLTHAPTIKTITRILWFIAPHAARIPQQGVVTHLLPLLDHDDALVRKMVLRIIFASGVEAVVEAFIRGTWAWSSSRSEEENHWGSLILCEHGHQLPFADILRRVHPTYLGYAVSCRGHLSAEIEAYADTLHQQWLRLVGQATELPVDFPSISIETSLREDIRHFHRYTLAEDNRPQSITFGNASWGGEHEIDRSDLESIMSGDLPDRLREQQRAGAQRVNETLEQQRAEQNNWFAHRFFPDALEQVVQARPELGEAWVASVLREQSAAVRPLQLGSTFYEALCETLLAADVTRAIQLYRHLQTTPLYVFTQDHRTGIKLLDYALFRAQPAEAVRQLWEERLEQCQTDQEILQIVIAAQSGQGQAWLQSYIDQRLQPDRPRSYMRAITLLGLVDTEAGATQLAGLRPQTPDTWVRELVDTSLQRAQQNTWAKHWFRRFLSVPNDLEAWAAFCLLLRCVDQRFWVWYPEMVAEIGRDHVPSSRDHFLKENMDTINNAVKKNRDKLEKQFLGQKVKSGELWPWMK